MTEVELVAELFRQMAFSAAILGGFAMTFLSVLLSAFPKGHPLALWCIGAKALAAVLLIVATLGATLSLLSIQQMGLSFNFASWPAHVLRTKLITELTFFSGVVVLLSGLGLSGFARCRRTGLITLTAALVASVLLVVMFVPTF